MNHTTQVCTFPYAVSSTPTFNRHAHPVEMDSGSYSKPNYFVVWSPVHYPHLLGHYKTRDAAQKRADEINTRRGEWQYLGHLSNEALQPVYEWIGKLQAAKRRT